VDYAKQEKAHDELQKLKMSPGDVDGYISQFQMLGHSAHMNLNNLATLQLFAHSLLNSLADACINRESPNSFKQWAEATQRQHRNFLRKQVIHKDYRSAHPPPPPQGRWASLFQNRNQGRAPAPQQPHRNPNTIDTSAGKATTKEQKKKFHVEGQCYECERQGHMVRECPNKKTKVRSIDITKV